MGMSAFYGAVDEEESMRTLHRALELGCTFLDTAEMYGPFANEELLGKALQGKRQHAVIATKFGIRVEMTPGGQVRRVADGSPENVRRSVEGSLKRLRTDYIDLYYQHRIDSNVPIEETVGALAELVKDGKVRHLGLSEAAAETIRRAHRVHPIAAVQSEYSLWSRDIEAAVLPTLRELGIGLVAYSPLGRGFLSGRFQSPDELDPQDFRRSQPRLVGDNLLQNQRIAEQVRSLASRKGISMGQLALAWVLAQGDDIVPIPGTKRRSYLEENWKALEVELSREELEQLQRELPAAQGDRYDVNGMTTLYR
jgi:aryl-alcohol dehydrogenase-like predicted oxidoreductase